MHIDLIKAYCCNNAIISDPNLSSPEERSSTHAAQSEKAAVSGVIASVPHVTASKHKLFIGINTL